ncbi:MAG: DUF3488 domain-containing protein [Acidobacteria bacterium]|nr:DUF3488 domain-containing protein [Acidobacteriota bacterium]
MGAGTKGAAAVERYYELSLTGLWASGLLALASSGYLDAVSLFLGAAGLLLRVLLVALLPRLRLSRGGLFALAGTGLALGVTDFLFLSRAWLPAVLHLAFFLLALGLLAARPGHPPGWLALASLLALVAASWWSTNLYFFLALAGFLLFGVAALAGAEVLRSARQPGHLVRGPAGRLPARLAALSLLLGTGILVLTAGMFFVLPRTAQAAFQRLAPQRYRVPGFADQVRLGQLASVRSRRAPLLRVRFYSPLPTGALKWRGNALGRFDGRRWFNPPDAGERLAAAEGLVRLAENHQLWRPGQRMIYEVRQGAVASDFLFLAGTPEFLRLNAAAVHRTSGGAYRLGSGTAEGLRYGVYSFPHPDRGLESRPPGREAAPVCCLDLPELDARVAELARQVTAGLGTPLTRAEALEQHLRRDYAYSIQPFSEAATDPLAKFLFERRQGHCEYFASALAVMLRLSGIPSRVVTGFQGGIYNPVSGWLVIRAADAHSWVEAWMPDRGWTIFDPTPTLPSRAVPSPWTRLNWYLDAAETFWDEWVLRYDLSRQLLLAAKMESSGRDLSTHGLVRLRARAGQLLEAFTGWARKYGAAILVGIALAVTACTGLPRLRAVWRTRRRLRRALQGMAASPDASLLYARLLGLLACRGWKKPACLTPIEFARGLPPSPLSSLVAEFTHAYNELRFGSQASAALRMAVLLDEIRLAPGPQPVV